MKHRLLFTATALSLLTLAGCGSKEEPASSSTATATPTAGTETDTTVGAPDRRDEKPTADEMASRVLFDGTSFDGWEGNLEIFRIEDGAIVGGTLGKKVDHNDFLTTIKEYANFELRLKFMLKGEKTNAGVQIRSRRIDDPPHEMMGYQADLGQSYWGCLYDESRRRKVLTGPDKDELEKVLKREDWNDYRIRCEGKRIQLWINGFQTVDYTEEDDAIEQTGLIGLQIHGGPPGEAWYKDIEISEL